MNVVTPRSGGYGDVTATYIRKSEIPSRIYVKHQYKQESEYGSTWQYTSNIRITKLSQSVIYWYMYIISQPGTKVKFTICTAKGCSRAEKKIPELAGRFRYRRS